MKTLIKKLLPPLITDILRIFKRQIKKNIIQINPSKQELDVYYSKEMSDILDTWGSRNTWIEIQHILQDKRESKILDIACGTGIVMQILKNNLSINNIYGCDISDFLIEKAEKKGIKKEKLKICDATKLPYNNDEFDYNYSIGSLEHFTKDGITKFLKESKRVTKISGYHLIPVSRSDNDEGWITNYQSYFNNSLKWWTDICKKEFNDILVLDSGWEDEISVGKWLILKK
mgnify:CR=1 FL=1|jgi:ubiquinone/menaquinone biosynthesis C-methylase UbiE|tara:strand:- start:18862 stop:19551 length:690 start_codon:yes stop_codon:yes gene_type:complete